MKILVTGGAGFIGSHVVDAYIDAGHDVVVVDNLSTGREQNLNPSARFVQADIRDASLERLFEDEGFSLVNHHAAQIDVRKSVADPVYDLEVNVLGSLKLLQLCKQHRVSSFIFASTGGAIYGEQDYFPADENHPTRPVSPYGVAKLAVENYMRWHSIELGMNCTALRYANVYGPRQNALGEAGVVAIFCHRMRKSSRPVINGDGGQTRDFVYVSDVVDANVKALQLTRYHEINIGTGVETDINTLFRTLNRQFGGGFEEVHNPPMPGEQRRSAIDASRAREIIGWQPLVGIERGLEITAEYFKSQG